MVSAYVMYSYIVVGREEELHARLTIDYVHITLSGVKICKAQSTLYQAAQMGYIQIAVGYVTSIYGLQK